MLSFEKKKKIKKNLTFYHLIKQNLTHFNYFDNFFFILIGGRGGGGGYGYSGNSGNYGNNSGNHGNNSGYGNR